MTSQRAKFDKIVEQFFSHLGVSKMDSIVSSEFKFSVQKIHSLFYLQLMKFVVHKNEKLVKIGLPTHFQFDFRGDI